ncbi:hypothetical protein CEXT_130851 [Caerostris extrusa]|uniref:Gag/pol protein n=1 Tax=Caerostris extrusa TaxID=172846 RepID=A0AAV4VGS3_CAEEX|nr:hypothetical protein CEXT_130851 [Caerostris extrusa]
MTGTRPDIAYANVVVPRTLEFKSMTKRENNISFLKGTIDKRVYKSRYKIILKSYSDANHSGDHTTGRSTMGVVCIHADGAISWLSQRQSTVAIYTTESEIITVSEAAKKLVWLKRFVIKKIYSDSRTPNISRYQTFQNKEATSSLNTFELNISFVREMMKSERNYENQSSSLRKEESEKSSEAGAKKRPVPPKIPGIADSFVWQRGRTRNIRSSRSGNSARLSVAFQTWKNGDSNGSITAADRIPVLTLLEAGARGSRKGCNYCPLAAKIFANNLN